MPRVLHSEIIELFSLLFIPLILRYPPDSILVVWGNKLVTLPSLTGN